MATGDGRADFELLSGRMMPPAVRPDAATVTLYVFDLLRMGAKELLDHPLYGPSLEPPIVAVPTRRRGQCAAGPAAAMVVGCKVLAMEFPGQISTDVDDLESRFVDLVSRSTNVNIDMNDPYGSVLVAGFPNVGMGDDPKLVGDRTRLLPAYSPMFDRLRLLHREA